VPYESGYLGIGGLHQQEENWLIVLYLLSLGCWFVADLSMSETTDN
jgi:hypothetical protein